MNPLTLALNLTAVALDVVGWVLTRLAGPPATVVDGVGPWATVEDIDL